VGGNRRGDQMAWVKMCGEGDSGAEVWFWGKKSNLVVRSEQSTTCKHGQGGRDWDRGTEGIGKGKREFETWKRTAIDRQNHHTPRPTSRRLGISSTANYTRKKGWAWGVKKKDVGGFYTGGAAWKTGSMNWGGHSSRPTVPCKHSKTLYHSKIVGAWTCSS